MRGAGVLTDQACSPMRFWGSIFNIVITGSGQT